MDANSLRLHLALLCCKSRFWGETVYLRCLSWILSWLCFLCRHDQNIQFSSFWSLKQTNLQTQCDNKKLFRWLVLLGPICFLSLSLFQIQQFQRIRWKRRCLKLIRPQFRKTSQILQNNVDDATSKSKVYSRLFEIMV